MGRDLTWQTIQIPFSAGLATKEDPRLASPPALAIARDVRFSAIGGLDTRLPFSAMANAIFGGGSLSSCRYLAVVGGELCLFTSDTLYSWNAQLSAWVARGTHLAVSVTESPQFATTGDQIDGDRAELAGTVVFAWTEGTQVYAAALDKVTGSVLVSPTAVSTAVGRPRLVALATKILLFVDAGANNLTVRAIDPAAPATAIGGAGTSALAANYNAYYDTVRVPGADTAVVAARRVTTTAYSILKVTAALAITAATPARTCDGPIAISVDPTGTNAQIVRANGGNIQGDLVSVGALADVFTAQAIGSVAATPVNQIAAAHRSVQNGGAYRCYVFWSSQESATSVTWTSKSNWVDTANALGTQANFVRHLGVASRAFDFNGAVYVWMVFAGATTFNGTGSFAVPNIALQNTYFLYRDDAFLCAKSIAGQGGGFAPSTGRLPGVALTSGSTGFSWCGTKRRKIDLSGGGKGFAAREPVDVGFTFDTNAARRSAVLGATLYIAAGEILQYDGARLTEVGFHIYPWVLSMIDSALGGSIAPGTYAYKGTWRCPNARGESERSTTATIGEVTVTGNSVTFPTGTIAPLTATHKTVVPPAVEFWRTIISPTPDFPFYLITSNDPTALTNPNRYEPNDPTASSLPQITDFLADSSLTNNEANPENDGILENLSPPPASIIFGTDTRIVLLGVAGDPDRGWYSKQRNNGEIAAFHDTLTFDVPPTGGAITSGWFQDEVLYVGRANAIYALAGSGLDNFGLGQAFGPARIVSADVGPVSHEAHVLTPIGTVFKSAKGWQLLDRGGQIRYIGGAVSAFDADTVLAMHVMTSQHQVKILTSGRLLVWDYRGAVDTAAPDGLGQWAESTVSDGLHAIVWNGTYVYLTATGPKIEQASYSGLTYGMDVETSWIKGGGFDGFAKFGAVMPLGAWQSTFLLRVRLARDYQYDGAGNPVYFDDKVWTPSPTVVGSALQVRHTPSGSNGNAQALKVRLTAVTEATRATLVTTSLSPQVTTSGAVWTATWSAVSTKPGEMGNAVSMALSFELGANLVDVRDHFTYSASLGRWVENLNRVGVRVACQAGTLTVAQLEAAIAAGSTLVTLGAADATPSKTINAAGMAGQVATAALTGGAYGAPSGEAMKLTGLGLDIGIRQGLNKRLTAAQKQ